MNEYENMEHLIGLHVRDEHELFNLSDIIEELEDFIAQFSTHAMSDHALFLKGKYSAYKDVLDYLKRLKGV